jgi:lipopolysaccharide export system permease protein
MRLLDRYLLRELLVPLAYCLAFFLIAFIAFDLFGEIADFQKKDLTGGDILEYYVDKAPEFLVASYIMPMSLLLALLYALTNHSRHNELTAMRAAAIPLWRIAMPHFAVGVALSLLVFYVNEQWVPAGIEAANRVLVRRTGYAPGSADHAWQRNVFFLNPNANRTWRIGAYHMLGNVMFHPQFDWRQPDGSRIQLSAERARWINRHWVFTNVERLEFSSDVRKEPAILKADQLTVPELTETPRIIKSEIKIGAVGDNLRSLRKTQVSSVEILSYLKLHPRMDRKHSDSLRTLLHSRLAAPWICFVVVLIAVPFGAIPGRRNVFVGVASSVFICFTFLVMKDLTLALGSGGYVPPWLAAWAPNLLFSTTGLALMWRVR